MPVFSAPSGKTGHLLPFPLGEGSRLGRARATLRRCLLGYVSRTIHKRCRRWIAHVVRTGRRGQGETDHDYGAAIC